MQYFCYLTYKVFQYEMLFMLQIIYYYVSVCRECRRNRRGPQYVNLTTYSSYSTSHLTTSARWPWFSFALSAEALTLNAEVMIFDSLLHPHFPMRWPSEISPALKATTVLCTVCSLYFLAYPVSYYRRYYLKVRVTKRKTKLLEYK